ncbi:MAG: superoxide dismutase [Ni], partial [Verrucomicrobia bacterium]|nr:superoxide dismutase [Ni] [Verrucomicrobiota bacterium]
NQLSRWVATKEDHASKIQKIIAEYFLTQRIKSSSDKYDALLKGAHAVMVAAMKCKQGVDVKNAESLKSAIESFQSVYEK